MITSDGLASKLAPKLQDILRSREKEIIAKGGNFLARSSLVIAFPHIIDEIPVILRSAIDLISEEFGKMNVNDLLAFLESHAESR